MEKRKLIAGNWKMHKTNTEAEEYAINLKVLAAKITGVDILICPAFTALASMGQIFKDSNIMLGGQNMHFEKQGAFTGEISGAMLKDTGAFHVILGHSERRQIFGEENELINKKVHAAFDSNLIPILCIGETIEEKNNGQTLEILEKQIRACLKDVSKNRAGQLIIAYEPIWAISSDDPNHVPATPDDAEQAHNFIRKLIQKLYDKDISENIRILYGGSVKPENARAILEKPDIDGALVGGASLEVSKFTEIILAAK